MNAAVRELVRRRAGERCEYCHLPQAAVPLASFHIEHVVARQHGGGDDPANLALACDRCNLHKGPNLAGIDPETGNVVPLFHPRQDAWDDHFRWERVEVVGLTASGRATVRLLNMNTTRRLKVRKELRRSEPLP